MKGASVRCERGFTIVEMMVATAVSLVVALALATLVVGIRRLAVHTFGVAKASLDLRAERERLLFRSLDEGGNARWAGLLSARKIRSVSSDRVVYDAIGVDASSGRSQGRENLAYERVSGRIDGVEAETDDLSGTGLFFVTLERTSPGRAYAPSLPDGLRVCLTNRVVVPAFGVEQVSGIPSPGSLLYRVWGCE